MIKLNDFLSILLLLINISFLLFYSLQLLIFTDEFAVKNIGSFNHAIAGLSEIIGIIFLCLSIGLFSIFFLGPKNHTSLLITIFFTEFIISINFWRYVFTNSPGESNLKIISINASIFLLMSIMMIFLIFRLKMIKQQ